MRTWSTVNQSWEQSGALIKMRVPQAHCRHTALGYQGISYRNIHSLRWLTCTLQPTHTPALQFPSLSHKQTRFQNKIIALNLIPVEDTTTLWMNSCPLIFSSTLPGVKSLEFCSSPSPKTWASYLTFSNLTDMSYGTRGKYDYNTKAAYKRLSHPSQHHWLVRRIK